MIRLLIAFIIVALLLTAVSRMLGKEAASAPEDTIVGDAYEPYVKAQNFNDEYEQALGEKRNDLDEQIDND
jgi:hypothetical protein